MSRTAAKNSITTELLRATLQQHGVKLLGGGLDEAPFAYKDIREVMQHQQQLIDVMGLFYPKIVQMDGTSAKTFKHRRRNKTHGEITEITGE